MKAHMMRVITYSGKRSWWIWGDNAKDDLVKFRPRITKKEALKSFQREHGKIELLYTYDGACEFAPAIMSVTEVKLTHREAEEGNDE